MTISSFGPISVNIRLFGLIQEQINGLALSLVILMLLLLSERAHKAKI